MRELKFLINKTLLSDSDEEIRTHSSEGKSVQRGNSALEKCPSSEKFNCDINVTPLLSPTSRVSKIPRLVTSPLSSTPSTKGVPALEFFKTIVRFNS